MSVEWFCVFSISMTGIVSCLVCWLVFAIHRKREFGWMLLFLFDRLERGYGIGVGFVLVGGA